LTLFISFVKSYNGNNFGDIVNLTTAEFNAMIQDRTEEIKKVEQQLLSEFIGIDPVIKQIFELILPWYVLPSLVKRPLIVTLVSLPGNGKTSLVRRIAQLLGLEGSFVEFDMGQRLNTSIIDTIEGVVGKAYLKSISKQRPLMILSDEFTAAATKDEKGNPIKANHGNQDYHTLLSDGRIPSNCSRDFGILLSIVDQMEKCNFPIELLRVSAYNEIGVIAQLDDDLKIVKLVTNCEILEEQTQEVPSISNLLGLSSSDIKPVGTIKRPVTVDKVVEISEEYHWLAKCLHNYNYNIRNTSYEESRLARLYDNVVEFIRGTSVSLDKKIFKSWKIGDLAKFLRKLNADGVVSSFYDLSNSLIFQCCNLPSLYEGIDSDNRISADTLRVRSESITLDDIKKALKHFFESKHISRFGNNMIAYPSFSSQDYRSIIEQRLNQFTNTLASSTCGFRLNIHPSLYSLVYENGVYPTQGTRPVYSTMAMIEGVTSQIVFDFIKEGQVSGTVKYDNDKKLIVITSDSGYISSRAYIGEHDKSKQKINHDILAKNSVSMAAKVFAYLVLFGVTPRQVVAGYGNGSNIFLEYNSSESRAILLKNMILSETIKAAQDVFFGDRAAITNASTTMLAASYVRFEGLGKRSAVMNLMYPAYGLVEFADTDTEIQKLVTNAYNQASLIVHRYKDAIKSLAIASFNNDGYITKEMINQAIRLTQLVALVVPDDYLIVESYEAALFQDDRIKNIASSYSSPEQSSDIESLRTASTAD
jgi:hypothetical protein